MAASFLSPSWHRVSTLRPRLRAHVQAHRHRARGQSWYVVQDDISGRTHRFTPPVYLFIGLMDGRRSVAELWNLLVGQLGDDAPGQDDIIQILSQLHAADLLQGDVAPDAAELFGRYETQKRQQFKQRIGNPLAIRLPLFDPDAFLTRTLPFVRGFFSATGAAIWMIVVGAGLALVALNWETLSQDGSDSIFARENLVMMAAIFPVLKIIHELGHGYATKHYGGPVHEFGLMFLVFAPSPYADASASAAFREPKQRALVAAAGMMVELFVAALATFFWALAEPGFARAVAFNVMFIAGVSTILFNANPLLRFDGYYILCDLARVPNLGQRADRYWGYLVQRHLFGVKDDPPPTARGEKPWLILYAPLAFAYRVVLTIGIAIFVATQFFVLGVIAAILGVARTLVWPILKGFGFILASPRLRAHRARANLVAFGGLAALGSILFLAPAPMHSNAEAVLWIPEESFVRASADGFVRRLLADPDAIVARGDALFESEDPSAAAELNVLRAQRDAAAAKLDSTFDDRVQADLARQELSVRQAAFDRALSRNAEFTARAGMSGRFVASKAEDLPARFARRGDVLGYVMEDQARLVRAVVTQSDIDLVRQRLARVEVKLSGDLSRAIPARIVRETPAGSDRLPSKALADIGGGRLAADPRDAQARDQGQAKTLQRTFQFDLELAEPAQGNFGAKAYARFDHGSEPLAWQAWRAARQLFLARFNA